MYTIAISGKTVWRGDEDEARREFDAATIAAKADFRAGKQPYTITLLNALGVCDRYRAAVTTAYH